MPCSWCLSRCAELEHVSSSFWTCRRRATCGWPGYGAACGLNPSWTTLSCITAPLAMLEPSASCGSGCPRLRPRRGAAVAGPDVRSRYRTLRAMWLSLHLLPHLVASVPWPWAQSCRLAPVYFSGFRTTCGASTGHRWSWSPRKSIERPIALHGLGSLQHVSRASSASLAACSRWLRWAVASAV